MVERKASSMECVTSDNKSFKEPTSFREPLVVFTAWKISKYENFSGAHFCVLDWIQRFTQWTSVFNPNTKNYGPLSMDGLYIWLFGYLSRSLWILNSLTDKKKNSKDLTICCCARTIFERDKTVCFVSNYEI